MSLYQLCRECLRRSDSPAPRCRWCASPRQLAHAELGELTIAHVDCDAFYAAIEKRDAPELADRPVIIGGGRRGVVLTACYVARTFGVRSAMPMFKALRACPHAVIVKPHMAKYAALGRDIRARMLQLTPAVEPLSIDEAFMDMTGTERLHGGPAAWVLARFQAQIERELGITVSVGLSHNKFLAKLASDLDKPRGFAVIGRAETRSFLADKSVSLIWGVGKAMQAKLARDGIEIIADLQAQDARILAQRYGSMGLRLSRLSIGEDARNVSSDRKASTVSAETTFNTDLSSADDLHPHLRRLAEKVSARLKAQGLAGRSVVLKLKTADFKLRTRNLRVDEPTDLADLLFRSGRELLARELDGTRFRLIGIGVGDIQAAPASRSGDLIDLASGKRARAESAMDDIRARFGPEGVALGLTFAARARTPP